MPALTNQVVPHAGAAVTMTTGLGGTSGNTAPCGAGLGLLVHNTGAGAANVSIHVPSAFTFDGLPVAGSPSNGSRVVSCSNTGDGLTLIPLVASTYADPTTGLATFDVAAGTVSAGVVAISA